jgi:hypothetical protein
VLLVLHAGAASAAGAVGAAGAGTVLVLLLVLVLVLVLVMLVLVLTLVLMVLLLLLVLLVLLLVLIRRKARGRWWTGLCLRWAKREGILRLRFCCRLFRSLHALVVQGLLLHALFHLSVVPRLWCCLPP